MTLVALALVALLAGTVLGFVGLLRSQQRAHTRREDLLLNQLLHAVGKTWTSPPSAADEQRPQPESPPWYASPEQLPLDE